MISIKSLVRDCTLAIGKKQSTKYSHAVQYLFVRSPFAIGIHWCDRMIQKISETNFVRRYHYTNFSLSFLLLLLVYWIFDQFRFYSVVSFFYLLIMVNKAYNCSRITIQMIVYVLTCQLQILNRRCNNLATFFINCFFKFFRKAFYNFIIFFQYKEFFIKKIILY